jgi:hypothetical protein
MKGNSIVSRGDGMCLSQAASYGQYILCECSRLGRLSDPLPAQKDIASPTFIIPHDLRPFLLHCRIAILVSTPQSHIFSNLLPWNLISSAARCRGTSGSEGLVVI